MVIPTVSLLYWDVNYCGCFGEWNGYDEKNNSFRLYTSASRYQYGDVHKRCVWQWTGSVPCIHVLSLCPADLRPPSQWKMSHQQPAGRTQSLDGCKRTRIHLQRVQLRASVVCRTYIDLSFLSAEYGQTSASWRLLTSGRGRARCVVQKCLSA